MSNRDKAPEFIAKVPAGTKVIRRATMQDRTTDPARIALVELPDGKSSWLRISGKPADDEEDPIRGLEPILGKTLWIKED